MTAAARAPKTSKSRRTAPGKSAPAAKRATFPPSLPDTPLARKLWSLRQEMLASGLKPLSRDDILALKRKNRGGTRWPGETA